MIKTVCTLVFLKQNHLFLLFYMCATQRAIYWGVCAKAHTSSALIGRILQENLGLYDFETLCFCKIMMYDPKSKCEIYFKLSIPCNMSPMSAELV